MGVYWWQGLGTPGVGNECSAGAGDGVDGLNFKTLTGGLVNA